MMSARGLETGSGTDRAPAHSAEGREILLAAVEELRRVNFAASARLYNNRNYSPQEFSRHVDKLRHRLAALAMDDLLISAQPIDKLYGKVPRLLQPIVLGRRPTNLAERIRFLCDNLDSLLHPQTRLFRSQWLGWLLLAALLSVVFVPAMINLLLQFGFGYLAHALFAVASTGAWLYRLYRWPLMQRNWDLSARHARALYLHLADVAEIPADPSAVKWPAASLSPQ